MYNASISCWIHVKKQCHALDPSVVVNCKPQLFRHTPLHFKNLRTLESVCVSVFVFQRQCAQTLVFVRHKNKTWRVFLEAKRNMSLFFSPRNCDAAFLCSEVRILRTHSLRKCALYPEGFEVFKSCLLTSSEKSTI